jgi:hypothetical protein
LEGWKDRILPPDKVCNNDNIDGGIDNAPFLYTRVLSNCSHYAMLEDEGLYGKEVRAFLHHHDPEI